MREHAKIMVSEFSQELNKTKTSYAGMVIGKNNDKSVENKSLRPIEKIEKRKVFSGQVVRQGDGDQDPVKIKQVLEKEIGPGREGFEVKKIVATKDRVIVEAAPQADLEKIYANEKIKALGLSVVKPKRKLPRMIVYDVPKEIKDGQLAYAMFHHIKDLLGGITIEAFY